MSTPTDILCPRAALIENLQAQLKSQAHAQVRGSPASGNTVIRRLLENHILPREPDYTIHALDGWDEKLINQIRNTPRDHSGIACADPKYR